MKHSHSPSSDAVARRIRERRVEARFSLRELARLASDAGNRRRSGRSRSSFTVSAAYLSLIENGKKVPDEPVAIALAEALGDDPDLYRAWVRVRKRADLDSALAAGRLLTKRLGESEPGPIALPAPGDPVPPDMSRSVARPDPPVQSPAFARLRVPIIAAGDDPGAGVRPACEVIEWRRLDPARLSDGDRARLERPFAIRPGAADVARAGGPLAAGQDALVLRSFLPFENGAVHAVRHAGRVLLSRVMWNGRQLLLLPAEGASDFEVLEEMSESRLRDLVLGFVIGVEFEPRGGGP